MSADTSTNGELTAENVQSILVQPLAAASVFLAAGPRVFDSASPVRIPKLTGFDAEPEYHGENELIGEANPETAEVLLLPETLKSFKVIHRFSNELARQSVIGYATAMQDALVARVAAKLDAAFLAGAGDGVTEIKGVTAQPGVQEITDVGAANLDALHDAIGLAMGENAAPSAWFMRSDVFVALRKLKDTSGRYIVQPDVTQAGAYRLLSIPVTVTNRLPRTAGASDVVLADMAQVAVARDLAPSVKLLDQTYAAYDQMALRVVTRYDVGLLNPEGVVVLRGVTA